MNVSGLIFAAGLGTRLRPITLTIPKPLVKINEKPIIEYQIDWFVSLGIKEVFINTHYFADQFEYLPKKYSAKCQIVLLNEPEILGHGGTLLKVKNLSSNNSILTCNGDTIIKVDSKDVDSLLALKNAIALFRPESNNLGFDEEGRLIRIKDNKLSGNEEEFTGDFAGLAIFTKQYLSVSEFPGGFLGLFGNEDIVEVNAQAGEFVKGYFPETISRFEITVPDDIKKVENLLKNING